MTKPWQLIILGAVFAVLFGMVGSFDYQDAKDGEQIYCTMVQEGTWPAYDNSIDCANEHSAKRQKKTIIQHGSVTYTDPKRNGQAEALTDKGITP